MCILLSNKYRYIYPPPPPPLPPHTPTPSFPSPYTGLKDVANKAHRRFMNGGLQSDHLMVVRAFDDWKYMEETEGREAARQFCWLVYSVGYIYSSVYVVQYI